MNVDGAVLLSEFEKTKTAMTRIADLYGDLKVKMDASDARTLERAVFLSELFVNYYTCLETLLFRVSQAFENALPVDRWHSELMRKMTLDVPGVRIAAISDATWMVLEEFRKFRHFKRYYCSMDYDWKRLNYLRDQFDRLLEMVPSDMERFEQYLREISF